MPGPELAVSSLPKAWPFDEAAKLARRLAEAGKAEALFETGYGPSGLPHIGTFGEVARTSWVRRAFTELTGLPSRLLAFSDDMDGLRKIPDNLPRPELLREFLGRPLSAVPDPFGTHESLGAHNNARLRAFLDRFGFDYAFASATDYYRRGVFDAAALAILTHFDAITAVILPTLGAARRATYSPILPIHPRTGVVMQVAVAERQVAAGTIVWRDPETGEAFETAVTGGAAKMQWKADFAMRWYALAVDYEMSGKDLIDSVRLSGQICKILGREPPQTLIYELFLDENGQKISKSKGNGLSVDQWLRYAPPESLAQFMYNAPQRAKRLFFDVIPRAADEYLGHVAKAQAQRGAELKANPAWHIHHGAIPEHAGSPIGFAMLLNLAAVANAETPEQLWRFIRRYDADVTPQTAPALDRLVAHALAYYRDFVAPAKRFRAPTETERAALRDLADSLRQIGEGASAETLQTAVFEVGKRHEFAPLRDWFVCLYQVLLGQDEGPRFGGFAAIYGVAPTVALIEDKCGAADR